MEFLEILTWFLVALPMLGVAVFWSCRPRKRPRARLLVEAGAAVLVSVFIAFGLGAVMPGPGSSMYLLIPFAVGGSILALSVNRASNDDTA